MMMMIEVALMAQVVLVASCSVSCCESDSHWLTVALVVVV